MSEPAYDEMFSKQPKKKSKGRAILAFLIFEMIFTGITAPLIVFYGPFEKIKAVVVGSFSTTFSHQYQKIFLSDEAVRRIVGDVEQQVSAAKSAPIQKKSFVNVAHTDKIERVNIKGLDFEGIAMIVYDPSRVEVGYSSMMPKAGEVTSAIAKRNKAALAVNGGGFIDEGWTGNGGAPTGVIFHNSEVVYSEFKEETNRMDIVGFTEEGQLIAGTFNVAEMKKLKFKEALSFGPPLIINGKPVFTEGDGGRGFAPRTALGQREDGAVVFLVTDGRDPAKGKLGASLRDVQDILLHQFKCISAANLDGGSSTTMYYQNKVINKLADGLGERAVPTVFLAK